MNIAIQIIETEQTMFEQIEDAVMNPKAFAAKQRELAKLRKAAKKGNRKWC
jgi:hypothetical protein